ncbi:hypothetical protein [Vibrio sp. V09_P4A23P171]|uniref:hypothetical protein n=1 Tax=Vibrio sp. V09_P4A23P171 TaxID=1938664 RepID=UPI001595EF47|nr:hypothetical protein [Vibrio sp. V09_P4A23P171]
MDIQTAQKLFPIGQKVKYFPLLKDKTQFHIGTVCSEPWELCGEVIVSVTGKAGGLSAERLEVFEELDFYFANGEQTVSVSSVKELKEAIKTLPEDLAIKSCFVDCAELQLLHNLSGEVWIGFDEGKA